MVVFPFISLVLKLSYIAFSCFFMSSYIKLDIVALANCCLPSGQGFIQALFYSRWMVGKTQSWIEFWISVSSKSLKVFFIVSLSKCYKPQIPTKQTDLTNWFIIPPKNFCSCIQTIKSKHDGGVHVLFVSACYSWHSEIPHSQKNMYCEMKEEITSQKKLFIVKKNKNKTCDSRGKETFVFLFY